MTYWQYLHRPPLWPLLGIIFGMLFVHVGLGTLLSALAPHWHWFATYATSATSGFATATVLSIVFYRRELKKRSD
jgi:hypothetical protein